MSKTGVKVSGILSGVSGELFSEIEENFEFEDLERKGDTIIFYYEGAFFFIEDFMDRVIPKLDPSGDGIVDFFDLDAWTLARYTVADRTATVKKRNLNEVMEQRYSRE